MPQVDFYLLQASDEVALTQFACRLSAQIYRSGQSVYLHADNLAEAERLNTELWQFRPDSFLPHVLLNIDKPESQDMDAPISVGFQPTLIKPCDVLINLATEVPKFYSDFERIAEIVTNNDATKAQLREHYRFYQQQQCALKTHNISA